MSNNPVPAAAEGLPEINRRRLLGGMVLTSASIVAGGTAALAATSAPASAMTPREQAIWHMHELQRLAVEDGAGSAFIVFVGRSWGGPSTYTKGTCHTLMLDADGTVEDRCSPDFLASKAVQS